VGLYDEYRTSLMNAKYYAHRLEFMKRLSTATDDIVVAIASSAAFASLAVWKSQIGINFFSVVLGTSALISALRPVLRMTERIDRCAKLHYGYLEVYYRIQSLTSDMQTEDRVSDEHRTRASDISERYRALELEGDAYQSATKLLKIQDEVEQSIPADRLWLPQQ
jgi:hypothetical protein